jgi:crotonobetainyl-CoA:carnitine CoA-transferase CaiB-like acyl-CoA transferase
MQLFKGVRVVELAQYVMVPAASTMLADLGAEVIKVETPGVGDPYRSLVVDRRSTEGPNFSLEQNNRGKKSVCIDLKSAEGHALLCRLIESADVFMTSLRPAAIRKLGLTVEDLRAHNPKLIYARANGLGFSGPEAGKAGFDASSFWARGGFGHILSMEGSYTRQPRAVGDHASAVSLAFGIAGALFKRASTGEPSLVETSLLSMATWMLSNDLVASQDPGYPPNILQRAVEQNPLVGTYRTRDGRWIQLVFLDSGRFWPGLCATLGIDALIDDPRFHDAAARMAHGRELMSIFEEAFGSRDWADWQPRFEAFDAPWELVQNLHDLYSDPQTIENGMIFEIDTKDGYPVKLVSAPLTVDGRAAHADTPAPGCGEHSDDIFTALGLDDAQIEGYRTAGVIG